ncbi:hypothetical protein AB0L68_30910 [Streptomyces sp. NPDC052164]|uniref:hypothetical protein n=1 Tax=Streptomyces sp. NPDC052164 TaxID=3155529 RepID=UPI00341B33DA
MQPYATPHAPLHARTAGEAFGPGAALARHKQETAEQTPARSGGGVTETGIWQNKLTPEQRQVLAELGVEWA